MAVVCVGVGVVIAGVHMQQTAERVEMHKGVLHDKERTRVKALNLKLQKDAENASREAKPWLRKVETFIEFIESELTPLSYRTSEVSFWS